MATERTWTTTMNYDPTQATQLMQVQNFLFSLKGVLVSSGWAVVSSSDSSAYGVGDNVDRWVTSTNLVWNTAGNPHSWIVLRAPSDDIWLRIDLKYASSTNNEFSFSSADFATGGGTATCPTNSNTNRTMACKLTADALAQCRANYGYTAQGDCFYTIGPKSSQLTTFSFFWNVLRDVPSGVVYPYWAHVEYAATGSPTLVYTGTAAFDETGAGVTNYGAVLTPFVGPSSVAFLAYVGPGGFPDGTLPQMVTQAVICKTSGSSTILGTVVDVRLAPRGTGVLQGTVTPATGSPEYAIFGDVWAPCGGVVPIL